MSVRLNSVSKKQMMLTDLLIGLCIFILVIIFSKYADAILLISWILILCYLFLMRRYFALMHQLIATLLAVAWISFAKDFYGYLFDYLTIYGLNTFPLMAWTIALLGLGELCNNFGMRRKIFNFLLFVPLFWFCLILVETFAYHVMHLRNTMTSSFRGIPYFECIHAPTWMKVCYFSLGPLYYGLINSADYLYLKKFSAR
jgi:hypothetical protein